MMPTTPAEKDPYDFRRNRATVATEEEPDRGICDDCT
jgi:hypothetical protein